MRHIDSILACTDLSPESHHAVAYAAWVAGQRGADLHVISVVEAPEHRYSYLTEDLEAERIVEARAALKEVAEQIAADFGITVQTHAVGGSPVEEIVRCVGEYGVDLVVCGRHKHTAWEQITLGSVAARLVYRAPCDVVIAAAELKPGQGPVCVATDFSDAATCAAERAIELVKGAGDQDIWFAHGFAVPTGYSKVGLTHDEMSQITHEHHEKEFALWLGSLHTDKLEVHRVISEGKAIDVVLAAVKDNGVNMLVCGAQGRTGAAAVVLGRHARRLIHHAPCSVWVVRPEGQRRGFFAAMRSLMEPE